MVLGNGTDDVKVLSAVGTATQVLHGNASGAPSFSAVVEGDLSLSDVTTANVSTTAHGFAPKAPNNSGWFLDGTGAYDAVAEAELTFTDITTNDVSTSKHGFVPKAPNDAAKYLDGTGAWSIPAGSGGSGTYVPKTSDLVINNNNTLQNDPHMTFSLPANSVHIFEVTAFLTASNTNADWQIKFTGPAGFTMLWGPDGSSGALPVWGGISTANTPPALTAETTTLSFGHNTSGGPATGIHIRGYIETTGTSGTFRVQWAQATAQAFNSIVKKNSYLWYVRII